MRRLELPALEPARLSWLVLGLPLLGIARLVPGSTSFGLWLRLAAATLVVLLPGRLVARALGRRSGSATIAWSLVAVGVALAVTFAAHRSILLTIGVLGGIGLVALPFSLRRAAEPRARGRALVVLAGILFGIALWHVAGVVHGDALFHLGRVRKLDDFGSLSLRSVDEFRDGGLHPGYAFPLWHGFLALVVRLAGVDPAGVVLHEASLLAPLALLALFESGLAVFRSAWSGVAVLVGSLALYALAPGHGGSFATLALPGTVSRQLLVPALVALFFAFVREPSWSLAATLAAVSADLALVHPTYAIFLAIPLGGFVVVRFVLSRRDLARGVAGLAAIGVPSALVFAWLAPLVAETASHDPAASEKRRALCQYASQLDAVRNLDALCRGAVPFDAAALSGYHLKPEVFGRTGAVAVAALVAVPLAGLAPRRRWAALVLGGSLAVLGIELWPLVFPRFADLVSLSQARRAAGFLPFAFAFAGGAAVLAQGLRLLVLPVALAAGIALQLAFPGDFELGLRSGGPAAAAWIALWGGLAALIAGAVLALRGRSLDRTGALAAVAAVFFVLPVASHASAHWTAAAPRDGQALTAGLVHALRTAVPRRATVYADLETSYRISAYAPVYVANAPPAHVADTRANDPYGRRRALLRFLRTGDLAIPRRAGATWLVLRRRQLPAVQRRLPQAYADDRFVLLRLLRTFN